MHSKYPMCIRLIINWSRNFYYSTNTDNIILLLITTYNNPNSEEVLILKDSIGKAGAYIWKI